MSWLVSRIFPNGNNTIKQWQNSTLEWSLILSNTSLEKLELNTLDCYGDFKDLNSKEISHLLKNLKEITRLPSIIFRIPLSDT